MKLTATIKLHPTESQADSLRQTMQAVNAGANYCSQLAWDKRVFGRVALQKLAYYDLRANFGLSAQSTCLCIFKVADAYKLDKKTQRTFRPLGAVAFDDRVLRFQLEGQTVSIWTLAGRIRIPFVGGKAQLALLTGQRGESDLVYRQGEFYLYATCEVEEAARLAIEDVIGLDLGIVNIAVDSDGQVYSGSTINAVRHRHRRLRARLQTKGTKSTRRRLKKLSGKERRFAKHTNHALSKQVVVKAKGTGRGIGLEELTHIRQRVTAKRPQRATLHSWSFGQLRAFIEYKAYLAGVPVYLVDPRNTSRTCPRCGHMAKANRKSQARFACVVCGYSALADHVAAENIRRAAVTQPYVSDTAARR